MSSPTSPGDKKVVGTLRVPSPPGNGTLSVPPTDPAAEIEAEIADHLATTAEQLESQGLNPTKARQQSQEKFGDVAAIGRRCYWIKQGDTLMFRGAIILLLIALCVGLAITTAGSWQAQTRMADQMNALTEQLKTLAENQSPARAAPEHPPQEITGKVYVATTNTPAANKEVMIVSAKDASIVRRVVTDSEGAYRSGPLAAGDYCLVSAFEPPRRVPPYYPYLQTAPIYVYPGLPSPGHDLDVAQYEGRLAIATSRPLPRLDVDGKYTIDARLLVEVSTGQRGHTLWNSSMKMPPAWPIHVSQTVMPDGNGFSTAFFELLSNDDLEMQLQSTHFGDFYGVLPAGKATIVAAVIADVIPTGYKPPALPTIEETAFGHQVGSGGPNFEKRQVFADPEWKRARELVSAHNGPVWYSSENLTLENDDFFWLTKGLGKLWLDHLTLNNGGATEPPKPFVIHSMGSRFNYTTDWEYQAPITSGQITHLRVEIPDDLESRIKDLVESTMDSKEFEKFTVGGNVPRPPELQQDMMSGKHPLFRKVKISIQGAEPLNEEPSSTPASPSPL